MLSPNAPSQPVVGNINFFIFYFSTTPKDVPKQHSINSYLIPFYASVAQCSLSLSPHSFILWAGIIMLWKVTFLLLLGPTLRHTFTAFQHVSWGEKGQNAEKGKYAGINSAPVYIYNVYTSSRCKYVYKKTCCPSQKLTLKWVNNLLTKFINVR